MIDDFAVEIKNEQQDDIKNLQHPQGVRQRIHPDWQALAINIFKELYDIDDELVEQYDWWFRGGTENEQQDDFNIKTLNDEIVGFEGAYKYHEYGRVLSIAEPMKVFEKWPQACLLFQNRFFICCASVKTIIAFLVSSVSQWWFR